MLNRSFVPVLLAVLVFAVPADLPAAKGGNAAVPDLPPSSFVIHGAVVLPDKVVPHRMVRLERLCGGHLVGQTFADSKGHYSLDLGIINSPVSGASGARASIAAGFENCFIHASLEGFRAPSIALQPLVEAKKTEAPEILLQPAPGDQNVLLSATDASAGVAARKDFDRGLDLLARAKLPDATKAMEKATSEEPKFASAWLSLGMLQEMQNQADAAGKSLSSAIAADEKFGPAYVEMAVFEASASQWDKAAEYTNKAILLDPDAFPRAYYVSTVANIRLTKADLALKSSVEGIRVDTDHSYPELQFMHGILLLNRGDGAGGRAQLENYLEIAPNGDSAEKARGLLKSAPGAK